MATDHRTFPIDPTAREQLAADGLRIGLLDTTDPDAYAAWARAESRGFHGSAETDEALEQRRAYVGGRRLTGVWDDTVVEPLAPVATSEVWPAEVTVPGRRSVGTWAISGVTVAATHRRRGIARTMIEAELRTAHELGLPLAALTVSESTIYGRFGFGPAALARKVTIDTRRASWTGPEPAGRVQFASADQLRDAGLDLVERVRLATPGQMSYDGILWDRQLGLMIGDDDAKKLRSVRFDDADGDLQGFAIFKLTEQPGDFTQHRLDLLQLVSATDDAYAGLWRFVLEMDLVSQVVADLRPVDEPVRWMVSDFRAVTVDEIDHLWIRVLDVPAALQSRTFASSGRLVIEVIDPLGFAEGRWLLDVDAGGSATVARTDETADVRLAVADLGSILLGGVSPVALAAAGRLSGDATRLEATFRSSVAPWLSIWF